MEFIRNRSTGEALNLGLINDISKLMDGSIYSAKNYYDVLLWSLEERDLSIFKLILSLDGKYYEDSKVNISDNIHALLWESIVSKAEVSSEDFILELLKIPDLFKQVELDLNQTHIHVIYENKFLNRKNRKIYFGTKLYIDKALEHGYVKAAKALAEYYHKYKK